MLFTLIALGIFACVRYAVVDRLLARLEDFGSIGLNGIIALAVLLPVATTIFASRRYRSSLRVRDELARLSLRDGLTGLPNQFFLSEWLESQFQLARRSDCGVAIIYVDLDRFKAVNDTYGHDVGDALLVAAAGRLRNCIDEQYDRLIRRSGDEFVIVSRVDSLRPAAPARTARLVIAALEQPFALGTVTLRISASVGLAVSDGRGTAEDLLRNADAAMYDAKGREENSPVLYEEAVHGRQFTPATLEPHLRRAAEVGGYRLVYQPVVNTDSGQMEAVETLLRWDHPERGPVSPAEFVPVLEDSGLIVPVGAWVFREAVRQAREWRQTHPNVAALRVTINVSARQLAHVGFADTVRDALFDHPIPSSTICLEITEGALMVDIEQAWSTLRLLRNLGLKVALDDFGTGYSSLSYLRQFSLDMLKVDKSFVDGLGVSNEDTAIVEHVVGMAQALGMVTVAEGVETPHQLQELKRLGCEYVQGYLLSPPVSASDISAMLDRGGKIDAATLTPSESLLAQLVAAAPARTRR